jgi:hypothetical protein
MAKGHKGAFGLTVDMDLSPLIRGVIVLDDKLDLAVAATVERQANIAEGWMKENASWTDRTGNARAGLRATTEHESKVHHTVWLSGRVPYQIWLEVRFAGKYAIITPALLDQGKKLMRTLTKVIERLNGGLTEP